MFMAAETLEGDFDKAALRRMLDAICLKLNGPPDFVLVSYTCHHDARGLRDAILAELPETSVLGSSTCRGMVSNGGVAGFGQPALGVFAIRHPGIEVGCNHIPIDDADHVETLVTELIRTTQATAGHAGEVPEMVWLHVSPGLEERVIHAVQAELGSEVLISGGSSADETIEGGWSGFGRGSLSTNGVGVALIYAQGAVYHHFECGYAPTELTGTVTSAKGRRLIAIDGQPAVEVYNRWTGGRLSDAISGVGGLILHETTWAPLGRVCGQIRTEDEKHIEYYCLLQPAGVGSEGDLILFADVTEGESLTLMTGTRDGLLLRPASVASSSISRLTSQGQTPVGALMVCCAGSMLALGDDIHDATDVVRAAYGDTPFLGIFTFGEQGSFLNGERQHGNLMISSSVFGA